MKGKEEVAVAIVAAAEEAEAEEEEAEEAEVTWPQKAQSILW